MCNISVIFFYFDSKSAGLAKQSRTTTLSLRSRYELPIGDAEHDADVDPVVIENACKHEFAHEHAQ